MTDATSPIRKSTPGHGGTRAGAGRKPKETHGDQAASYTLLAKAKAKRETYRAQMAELEYRRATGELMPAAQYERDLAEVLKTIAVTLESLPDVLERDAGLSGESVARAQAVIDKLREDLYFRVANMAAPEA